MTELRPPTEGNEPFKCQLLDSFAIFVQLCMASIALSSLIIKRHRERPQRPFIIWAFDTSKQAVAAGMVHFSNILIASISGAASEESENPCVWYFLNILLDTTLGIGILAVLLRGLHYVVDLWHIPDMKSGHYGTPPRLTAWLRQLLLFLTAWFFVKLFVVLLLHFIPFFATVAQWILDPLVSSHDTRLQVVVVMLIFPLIMNVIQAWLIDMVIKGKVPGTRRRSESFGDDGERDALVDDEDIIEDIDQHLGDYARFSEDDLAHTFGGHRGRLGRQSSGSSQPLLNVRRPSPDDGMNTDTDRGTKHSSGMGRHREIPPDHLKDSVAMDMGNADADDDLESSRP
ncbi:hypothetical protein PhCBS80983_g00320 [Powellomyces hirtus]|uniref:Uncharacterized protein n=1 Tax=Powellomyces hirtus TaxID=109895 RepID=A0A507EGR7_9FUNG|nr:hypothetical protein PhCBS80983_g00320 [Powellomyces hirtus]